MYCYYYKYGEQIRGWMREAVWVSDWPDLMDGCSGYYICSLNLCVTFFLGCLSFSLFIHLCLYVFVCFSLSLSVILWLWLINSVSHVRSALHSAVETGEDQNKKAKWKSSKNMTLLTARLTVTDNQENHMAIFCVVLWPWFCD